MFILFGVVFATIGLHFVISLKSLLCPPVSGQVGKGPTMTWIKYDLLGRS